MRKTATMFLIILISASIIVIYNPKRTTAQEMKSENYILQGGDFNIAGGSQSSENYKLADMVGETAANLFNSKGYIIQSGFQNSASGSYLVFSIDPNRVDFGELIPNIPGIKSVKISISNGKTPGYRILAVEKTPLTTYSQAQIPDTSCDKEDNHACTVKKSNRWTNTRSYGFGYRINGSNANQDFKKIDYYKPFPADFLGESPVEIFDSIKEESQDTGYLVLKINISAVQPVGKYKNSISLIAMPKI